MLKEGFAHIFRYVQINSYHYYSCDSIINILNNTLKIYYFYDCPLFIGQPSKKPTEPETKSLS